MIACSIPDGDDLVDLLLSRGADVNAKSKHSLAKQNNEENNNERKENIASLTL